MGLVKCNDCGKDRSDQVNSICPNCGSKLEEEKGLLWGCISTGFAILLAAAVVAAIMDMLK